MVIKNSCPRPLKALDQEWHVKADEEVKMIAAEALVLFARSYDMFILELTYRSWAHTEEWCSRGHLEDWLVWFLGGHCGNGGADGWCAFNGALPYDYGVPQVIMHNKPSLLWLNNCRSSSSIKSALSLWRKVTLAWVWNSAEAKVRIWSEAWVWGLIWSLILEFCQIHDF